jgi:hypothetical protein
MPSLALSNFRKREFRPERPNRPPKTPSRLAGDPDCSPALLSDRSPHPSLSLDEEVLLDDF